MNKFTDKLRKHVEDPIVSTGLYIQNADELLLVAADLLDEAEKALADMADMLLAAMESEGFDSTCGDSPLLDRLNALLARIRGEQ